MLAHFGLVVRHPQIARIMGTTWGPPGSCRPQVGPVLAPWTLLSGFDMTRWRVRHGDDQDYHRGRPNFTNDTLYLTHDVECLLWFCEEIWDHPFHQSDVVRASVKVVSYNRLICSKACSSWRIRNTCTLLIICPFSSRGFTGHGWIPLIKGQ